MTLTPSDLTLGQRLLERLDQAALFSQAGPEVTRLFCSVEHRRLPSARRERPRACRV